MTRVLWDAKLEMKDGEDEDEDEESASSLTDFQIFLDFDDELRKTWRMTHSHGLIMPSGRACKDNLWPFPLEDAIQTSSSENKSKLESDSSAPPLPLPQPPTNNMMISTSSTLKHEYTTHFPIPLPQKREGVCMKQKGRDKEVKEEGEQSIMFVVESEVEVLYDGYSWRKYGEKNIKNRIYPRIYYRCGENGCKIKKHVERSTQNPIDVLITYYGHHNHAPHF